MVAICKINKNILRQYKIIEFSAMIKTSRGRLRDSLALLRELGYICALPAANLLCAKKYGIGEKYEKRKNKRNWYSG